MSALPKKITDLAVAIRDAGGRAMLNGGCVRDELMGIQPKDWDVEVYGVEPVKLARSYRAIWRSETGRRGVCCL